MKPDLETFGKMAQTAYDELPEAFRRMSADVMIRVADFAEDDVLADLEIDDPYDLLGLYHGVDVTQKSLWDVHAQPDMVFLYRRPILRFWQTGPDTLDEIVRHVLVHEIGHHFGLSDDDMYGLEDDAYGEDG
ncbi:metallopeptidase family protein [Parvularcula dongshanensis]|uniref:Putative Zn-dependent protease with MMP-like domain n=1 Tax=Parvularcula dongshanensis TaxID=1173995 RepID=A0A840I6F7_9PROT|nr:metallopeptidase family protein [Parvularcula dongshanensis]MBB4659885.1 putative Zn-dependent protease with MMP-like domain [Parvularcula dongshanensis]